MHKKDNHPIDTSKGYETNDLPVRGVTIGVVAFFIFAGISGVLGLGFLALVPGGGLGAKEPPTRRIVPEAPNPILQNNTTAVVDLWNMREHEKKELHLDEKPVWVDRNKGVVKLPIDKAMDIEAKRLEAEAGGLTP